MSRVFAVNVVLWVTIISSIALAQPLPNLQWNDCSSTQQQNALPDFTNENVWHKNMELINPYAPAENSGEQFEFVKVVYGSSMMSQMYCIASVYTENTETKDDVIRLTNVNDPRNPALAALIYVKCKVDNTTTLVTKMKEISVWTDNSIGKPGSGHTFAIVRTHDPSNALVDRKVIEDNELRHYSEAFIIIDITEALNFVTTSNKIIRVDDTHQRKSVHLDGSSTLTDKIYVGYIRYDPKYFTPNGSHSLNYHTSTVSRSQGLFFANPLAPASFKLNPNDHNIVRGFVDVYKLTTLADHEYWSSSVEFIVPTRLVERVDWNDNSTYYTPIRCRFDDDDDVSHMSSNPTDIPAIHAHETHGHKVRVIGSDGYPTADPIANRVMLMVASYADGPSGGVFTQDVEYTDEKGSNSDACLYCDVIPVTVTRDGTEVSNPMFMQHWDYDTDRASPGRRKSNVATTTSTDGGSNWNPHTCHTVEDLHFDLKNHLFLTTDEYVYDNWERNVENDPSTVAATWDVKDASSDPTLSGLGLSGNYYNNVGFAGQFLDIAKNSDSYKDGRRLGCFLRIWQSSHDHMQLRGIGATETAQQSETAGPIGIYDVPEQSAADKISRMYEPRMTVDSVQVVKCNTGSDNVRGPNGIHHVRTVYGATGTVPHVPASKTEAFVAYYSQGIRVIDLSNFVTAGEGYGENAIVNKTVNERAYFDFTPTLDYNVASRHFYSAGSGGTYFGHNRWTASGAGTGTEDLDYSTMWIRNYFDGAEDLWMDLYDVDQDNNPTRSGLYSDENFVYAQVHNHYQGPWLTNSGTMILRYFRDKLGGTISGYLGSTTLKLVWIVLHTLT